MAIKNSKYNIHNGSDFETYHFETNQKQTKLLSKTKSELGSLDEFLFTGKKHTSGNVVDIKVPGIHTVINVDGLPSNVSKSVETLLYVKAFGEIGAPSFINYEIIDNNGNIYNKTVVGSKSTEWTEGGTSLENTLQDMGRELGSINSLTTKDKSSLVGALNELKKMQDEIKKSVDNANESIDSHNHDDRYIKIDNDSTLNSNINLGQNVGLVSTNGGVQVNVIKANNNGRDIELGNSTTSSLSLFGKNKDLLYNNKKVWTELNHGTGSGLDADKLDGFQGTDYAKVNFSNNFTKRQTFLEVETDHLIGKSGTVTLRAGSGGKPIKFNGTGEIQATGITLVKNGEPVGFGWARDVLDSVGFTFNNNKVNKKVYNVPANDNVIWFDREIVIQGRKLFLQTEQPAGNDHPIGSIWIG